VLPAGRRELALVDRGADHRVAVLAALLGAGFLTGLR
jgi:hypothetical protein